MQPKITPIAYSGISDVELADFQQVGTMPLACQNSSYVGINFSSQYNPTSVLDTKTLNFAENQFIVQDDDIFSIGFDGYPWTLSVNWREMATDYGYKHWGAPINRYLGGFNTTTHIIDPKVRKRGDTNLLLCVKNSIPVLIEYDRYTSLFQFNVNQYYLYSSAVQHVQWITLPNGEEKILMIVNNKMYFITIMSEHAAYPVLGAPIDVSIFSWLPLSSKGTYNNKTNYNFTILEFYYHNNTLCAFTSNSSGSAGTTTLYSFNDGLNKFLSDLTIPYGSTLIYYSLYNRAVNLLVNEPTYIGDYRWYIITPMSDLYSYSQNTDIRVPFLYWKSPSSITGNNYEYSYLVDIQENADTVYFYFLSNQTYGSVWVRLCYVGFQQPLITTALLNINNGVPYSAITGKLQINGDLFYPDFKWELSSRNGYSVLTGTPEITLTYPTVVNLRLTPSMPQNISEIVYEPIQTSDYPYLHLKYMDAYRTKPYYAVNIIDDRHMEVRILYDMIYKWFNHVELAVATSVPDIAPYIIVSLGNEHIRHCRNNTGGFCLATRPEFKTIKCNELCSWFNKNMLTKDILPDGEDIVLIVEDERENFIPTEQIAHVDVRLRF